MAALLAGKELKNSLPYEQSLAPTGERRMSR
jgi:hypothetical protein